MSKKNYISLSILAAVAVFAVTNVALADTDKPGTNWKMGPHTEGGPQRMGEGKERGMGKGTMNGVKPVVVGKVQSISGNTITLTSRGFDKNSATTTYTVDATNAKIMKGNATSTLASIVAGDNVVVEGTLSGTNVVATVIRDGMRGMMGKGNGDNNGSFKDFQGNGQPVVLGSVTSVSGNTVTVTTGSNVVYTVDATNAKIIKGNATSTVSTITTGDSVVVQGAVNGTAVTATSIISKGAKKPVNANNGSAPAPAQEKGFFGGMKGFFGRMFGF